MSDNRQFKGARSKDESRETTGRAVRVRISPQGDTVVAAYDWIGDAWRDHLAFLEDAKTVPEADEAKRNRLLRASVTTMFAHVDGLITLAFRRVEKARRQAADSVAAPTGAAAKSVKQTRVVHDGALKMIYGFIPSLQPFPLTRLRSVRHVLQHPTSRTPPTVAGGVVSRVVDFYDAYGLDVTTVSDASSQLDAWLAELCQELKLKRREDTERLVTDLAVALGELQGVREV